MAVRYCWGRSTGELILAPRSSWRRHLLMAEAQWQEDGTVAPPSDGPNSGRRKTSSAAAAVAFIGTGWLVTWSDRRNGNFDILRVMSRQAADEVPHLPRGLAVELARDSNIPTLVSPAHSSRSRSQSIFEVTPYRLFSRRPWSFSTVSVYSCATFSKRSASASAKKSSVLVCGVG